MPEVRKRIRLTNTKQKPSKHHPNPKGRPLIYNEKVAGYICQEIMRGRTLTSIVKDDKAPSITTVYGWLNRKHPNYNEEFFLAYNEARKIQAETLADETKDISDEKKGDVARKKIQISTRQWLASRFNPQKFSERMQVTGADMGPITFKVIYEDIKEVPSEELSGEEK